MKEKKRKKRRRTNNKQKENRRHAFYISVATANLDREVLLNILFFFSLFLNVFFLYYDIHIFRDILLKKV